MGEEFAFTLNSFFFEIRVLNYHVILSYEFLLCLENDSLFSHAVDAVDQYTFSWTPVSFLRPRRCSG